MKTAISALMFAVALVGCVPREALIRPTASGLPEAVFENTNVDAVRPKLINACTSRGFVLLEASSSQITCKLQITNFNEKFAARMLLGNAGAEPERKLRFILYQSGRNVGVNAQQWLETQLDSGQTRRSELDTPANTNDIQRILSSIGGK